MNKKLFWTGIVFQIIHLSVILFLFFPKIETPSISIDKEVLIGITYVLFNIFSLAAIFVGAIKD